MDCSSCFVKKKNLFRLGELLSRSAHPRVTGVIPPALPKVVGLSLLIPRCAFFLTDVPLVLLPRIFVGKISYLSGSRSPTCLPSGPRSVKFCVFLLVFLNQILALRRITRSQKFSTRRMQELRVTSVISLLVQFSRAGSSGSFSWCGGEIILIG